MARPSNAFLPQVSEVFSQLPDISTDLMQSLRELVKGKSDQLQQAGSQQSSFKANQIHC